MKIQHIIKFLFATISAVVFTSSCNEPYKSTYYTYNKGRRIRVECTKVNLARYGDLKMYDATSNALLMEGFCMYGKWHGEVYAYYDNGKKREECNYDNGLKKGKQAYFDEYGLSYLVIEYVLIYPENTEEGYLENSLNFDNTYKEGKVSYENARYYFETPDAALNSYGLVRITHLDGHEMGLDYYDVETKIKDSVYIAHRHCNSYFKNDNSTFSFFVTKIRKAGDENYKPNPKYLRELTGDEYNTMGQYYSFEEPGTYFISGYSLEKDTVKNEDHRYFFCEKIKVIE